MSVLQSHFPDLDKVLSKHDIDVSKLKMIGRGDKGTAFSDGNVVVKVTEDSREAMASANIIGADIPNVNHIYAVYKFGREIPYQEEGDEEPISTPYYLIIQDILDTKLNRNEKVAANSVGDFLVSMSSHLKWPFSPVSLIGPVKNFHYKKTHEILGGPGVDDAIFRLLRAVSNLYASRNVKFLDVSDDNVGKKDGKLVLFDLGVSESPKIKLGTI